MSRYANLLSMFVQLLSFGQLFGMCSVIFTCVKDEDAHGSLPTNFVFCWACWRVGSLVACHALPSSPSPSLGWVSTCCGFYLRQVFILCNVFSSSVD